MFDVANVYQLVVICFDDRAFSQQDAIEKWHQAVFHVASDACYEMDCVVEKHLEEWL
jgi:hypothetical protein